MGSFGFRAYKFNAKTVFLGSFLKCGFKIFTKYLRERPNKSTF